MATVLFYLPTYRPTYLPTYLPACLPACLSVCLYLPVPTCLCLPVYTYRLRYLSMPTCLYLPSVPSVCATVYAYLSVIWGKGRPDRRLCLIRIVLYGRSLAVHSNGGRLGPP